MNVSADIFQRLLLTGQVRDTHKQVTCEYMPVQVVQGHEFPLAEPYLLSVKHPLPSQAISSLFRKELL